MNFVLIPGPWTGPWIWAPVTFHLCAHGHQVHPVTLTGLDDADMDVSNVDLETHVNDVLSLMEDQDLTNVILVAHGSAGIIAGVVADRALDRVVRTVFVEAFVPQDGKSALDAFPEVLRDDEIRLIDENRGRWPVPDVTVVSDGQDLSPDKAMWIVEHCVGHPGNSLTRAAVLNRPMAKQRATYIVCTKDHFDDQISDDIAALRGEPTWVFRSIDTGHWPMVSAPEELAELLNEAAAQSV